MTVVLTEDNPVVTLAKSDYTRTQEWRSETEIVSAITTAAAWLGTDHINPVSYERARSALNAQARRRHLHGRAYAPLPSALVLARRVPFAEAVAAAGLRVTPRQETTPAIPRHELVRVFVDHCGFTPRLRDLERFATRHRIRLTDRRGSPPHAAVVAAVRTEFEQDGRKFPPGGRNAVPDDWQARMDRESEEIAQVRERHPTRREDGYSLDEVRSSIGQALDLITPGQRLIYGAYKALRGEHPHLMHVDQACRAAKRHGTSWAAVIREITAARADAARQGPADPLPPLP